MEKSISDVDELELRKTIFDEAKEVISQNKTIAKELLGDDGNVTIKHLLDSVERLQNGGYPFDGLSKDELKKKIEIAQRVDAALILSDFALHLPIRKQNYPNHQIWHHIGIFRAFLFCTDEKNKPVDILKKSSKEVLPPKAKTLVEEAIPEIEEIYSAILRIGFSSKIVDDQKKWKDAALKRFDDSKKGFEYIKREYLEEKSLYFFSEGKHKRDFETRLFNRIVKDAGLGNYGGQNLRDIARRKNLREKIKPTN